MAATVSSSTPVAAIAFRWLDILEKEFDKSYVGLDHQLAQMLNIREEDCDERVGTHSPFDDYEVQRKFLSNMAQCFVQLVHKAQTIFQTNAKLEAEILNLRGELAESRSIALKTDYEKKYLICALQASLLENHKIKTVRQKKVEAQSSSDATPSIYNHDHGTSVQNNSKNASPSTNDLEDEEQICAAIQMRLAGEIASIQRSFYAGSKGPHCDSSSSPASNVSGLEARLRSLEAESERGKRVRAELESELVGARLDAKYLDKELAGRIQQIQILLATNTSQEHKQKVWSQIEAEMHLQRSKTISNMCYSKQRVKDSARNQVSSNSHPEQQHSVTSSPNSKAFTYEQNNSPIKEGNVSSHEKNKDSLSHDLSTRTVHDNGVATITTNTESDHVSGNDPASELGKVKQVHLHKHDSDELGMAILGGIEHGLPIMISEVFPGSSVARSQKVCAGDVIVAVNGDSFVNMSHEDAVRYLSSLRGSIRFELQNTIEADIEAVCDMESRYYDLYDVDDSNVPLSQAAGTSPSDTKNPVQRIFLNGSSKSHLAHGSIRKGSASNSINSSEKEENLTELPKVHSSPRKQVSTTKDISDL